MLSDSKTRTNSTCRYYYETGHFTESQSFMEQAQPVGETTRSAFEHLDSPDTKKEDATEELVAILAETHHNLGCIGTESNRPHFTL
jgi:hypothetical protein